MYAGQQLKRIDLSMLLRRTKESYGRSSWQFKKRYEWITNHLLSSCRPTFPESHQTEVTLLEQTAHHWTLWHINYLCHGSVNILCGPTKSYFAPLAIYARFAFDLLLCPSVRDLRRNTENMNKTLLCSPPWEARDPSHTFHNLYLSREGASSVRSVPFFFSSSSTSSAVSTQKSHLSGAECEIRRRWATGPAERTSTGFIVTRKNPGGTFHLVDFAGVVFSVSDQSHTRDVFPAARCSVIIQKNIRFLRISCIIMKSS